MGRAKATSVPRRSFGDSRCRVPGTGASAPRLRRCESGAAWHRVPTVAACHVRESTPPSRPQRKVPTAADARGLWPGSPAAHRLRRLLEPPGFYLVEAGQRVIRRRSRLQTLDGQVERGEIVGLQNGDLRDVAHPDAQLFQAPEIAPL